MSIAIKIVLFTAALAFLFIPDAHAYIDPGTGSMLLQIIAACCIAAVAFGKNIIGFLRSCFGAKQKTAEVPEDAGK